MKHLFLLLMLLLGTGLLAGAQFIDGELYLEINLVSEPTVTITPKTNNTQITVSETDGLISHSFNSSITISIRNPETLVHYAILDYTEIVTETTDNPKEVVRDFFVWENSRLKIKKELQHFLPESFTTEEEALQYAQKHNIPAKKIKEIPMLNSTIRIQDENGNICYLETPVKIHSSADIYLQEDDYAYSGDFVLKTVQKNIVLNHFLPLEDYLAGVIQNEIGNNAPGEALKAQAVAARTHALALLLNNKHKADGCDLCRTTHCQVYKGKYLQNEQILQAVRNSASEVLLYNGNIADATYHSCCGGKTEAADIIWKGKPVDYLKGVNCLKEVQNYDLSKESDARKWIDKDLAEEDMSSWERGALSWHKSISAKQLAKNAGLDYINSIEIIQRGNSGRITEMKLNGNNTITLNSEYQIRQVFGNLLSSFFYIEGSYSANNTTVTIHPKATINIKGRGAGHGAGMCQVGALRKAREGMDYNNILQHYYPETVINKDWMDE
ncbi:MAG TPA: SpoIID/LytB domain-containing protein [Candidatus Cloacimonas sp.]|nr:SpoIID/LytB domain-containing protein [Candidatus Cloacimonas sp.]HPS61185.1 SpoIID/LytB domain-containing protein [Candidatus Cloacimonas sp.]